MNSRIILAIFFLLAVVAGAHAQKTIAVQSGSSWTFYEDFSVALRAAPAGATMYLPGGVFIIADGTDTISKGITIIGAGYYPDSTAATNKTLIDGQIFFSQGADNITIIGVEITGLIQILSSGDFTINNLSISRCRINGLGLVNESNKIENVFISECFISGNNYFSSSLNEPINIIVEKSNIWSPLVNLNGAIFRNCNFLSSGSTTGGQYMIYSISNCIIENSFISYCFSTGVFNNTFRNNVIFCSEIPGGSYNNTSISNSFNQAFANTFVNAPDWGLVYSYDYHLKASSVGKNAGTDGTDIGIYGTTSPFKPGAVPPNPHISFISVNSNTNPNGTLPVNIRVIAQDR